MTVFCFLGISFLLGLRAEASSTTYLDYVRGLAEERAGNIAKALEAYEKVVQQDPQALEVYRDIAQLNLRLGRLDAALQAAEKVKNLAPNDPSSFLFLGNIRVAQGNLAKAAEAFEKALQLDPGNLQALESLGNYYSVLDADKALGYYQRILVINPNDAETYFQMGVLHQKSGKPLKAVEMYGRSIQKEPQQLAPHLALAELYEIQKSTAEAVGEYAECIRLQPRNPLLYMRLGYLHYANRDWEAARSDFQNVRSLQPKDATVHYWLARVCEEQRQWGEAARNAQSAYQLSRDVQFLPLTAYYLTLDHRIPEAVKWLEKARKVDPENVNVLLFLGMDYLDLNKTEKAREILIKGVALYPNDAQMRFQLAMAEDRMGHFDDAQAQFQNVLKSDPKNAPAMNYLGYSWADRGIRLEEAETLLRQAVALEPHSGAFLDSLGWVRFKRGDPKEAVLFLEQALKESGDVVIYDHMGDVQWSVQNAAEALKAWNQALGLDPKNKAIRKKAKEARSRVLPGSDQRKYLNYIEGNLRQMADVRGRVWVLGKWHHQPLRAEGALYYQRPDRMIIDVGAAGQAPSARFRVQGSTVVVEPPSAAENLNGMPLQGLLCLPEFLSGKLTEPFDDQRVQVESSKSRIHYHIGQQEAWVDPERGVLTGFRRPNPQGGRDEIDVSEYDFVDGLWLPREIRLRNRVLKWDARLTFSGWVPNDPENGKPFIP
ncbi:MAG: tetratricopeptide repeat protein [Elusimicrobiota bacterium]|jgi:tetratricopeptide (TPR) repeat protein